MHVRCLLSKSSPWRRIPSRGCRDCGRLHGDRSAVHYKRFEWISEAKERDVENQETVVGNSEGNSLRRRCCSSSTPLRQIPSRRTPDIPAQDYASITPNATRHAKTSLRPDDCRIRLAAAHATATSPPLSRCARSPAPHPHHTSRSACSSSDAY